MAFMKICSSLQIKLSLYESLTLGWREYVCVYLLEYVLQQIFLRQRVVERNRFGTNSVIDVSCLEDVSHFIQNFNHSIKTHLRFPLFITDQELWAAILKKRLCSLKRPLDRVWIIKHHRTARAVDDHVGDKPVHLYRVLVEGSDNVSIETIHRFRAGGMEQCQPHT